MANFEIQECPMSDAVIKVIGVGGCGGNAVAHMVEQGCLESSSLP